VRRIFHNKVISFSLIKIKMEVYNKEEDGLIFNLSIVRDLD
jgi:hypothetical protein